MKLVSFKYIYVLVLLLGFQLSHAQLSRTHYIPPISADKKGFGDNVFRD